MDVLIIVLLACLFLGVGSGPWFPYAHGWGYGPSGFFWFLAIICLIVWLVRRPRS